jgi:hypothetical protein
MFLVLLKSGKVSFLSRDGHVYEKVSHRMMAAFKTERIQHEAVCLTDLSALQKPISLSAIQLPLVSLGP